MSLGWAKKISARRSRTGEMDAPVWRHGPVSRVTLAVREWIRSQIRGQPDVTLRELASLLGEAQHVRLSVGRMWLALRPLGLLPLKKSARRARAGGEEAQQRRQTWREALAQVDVGAANFSRPERSPHADDAQLPSRSTGAASRGRRRRAAEKSCGSGIQLRGSAHLSRPLSTPSNKPGRESNKSCARLRCAPPTRSKPQNASAVADSRFDPRKPHNVDVT